MEGPCSFFNKQDESFMWFMGPGLYNMLHLSLDGWLIQVEVGG